MKSTFFLLTAVALGYAIYRDFKIKSGRVLRADTRGRYSEDARTASQARGDQ